MPNANVRLEGGPMDGWLVSPTAAALHTDWSDQGRYVETDRIANDVERVWEWQRPEGVPVQRRAEVGGARPVI